ncbi:hypothetical protein QR680_008838 [Steinernema hermaphroditum]|uniref:Uncharacterized protein n=1 Tax=Steinernema hermaphroditum TaxID=289476 RepID=A0AA39II37_9BILA|nr:hypothetical protein QR680_008838 [Steinernema hermaphroditum]
MDRLRRTSILKQTDNANNDVASRKSVGNVPRRVSFSKQKVVKEYHPGGPGIPEASFEQDMNLTPSTEGAASVNSTKVNATAPDENRPAPSGFLNLTPVDDWPSSSAEDTTKLRNRSSSYPKADDLSISAVNTTIDVIQTKPSNGNVDETANIFNGDSGAVRESLSPIKMMDRCSLGVNATMDAIQAKSSDGNGDETVNIFGDESGAVRESLSPIKMMTRRSLGVNATIDAIRARPSDGNGDETVNIFDDESGVVREPLPTIKMMNRRSLGINATMDAIQAKPSDEKADETFNIFGGDSGAVKKTLPLKKSEDVNCTLQNNTVTFTMRGQLPLCTSTPLVPKGVACETTLNLFADESMAEAQGLLSLPFGGKKEDTHGSTDVLRLEAEPANENPSSARRRLRRSMDLSRRYPDVSVLANLTMMDEEAVKPSDTLLLSANRNVREPTYPESMLLDVSSFEGSVRNPTNRSRSSAVEKMDASVPMLECTYADESQHISKIETPDTLINMEGTTLMEDSATSKQIKSFAAVMAKKAETKDRSQDDEPMEESPVFLDVDERWLGTPLNAVRTNPNDCQAVKDLKTSAKELIIKNLQDDIRSLTDELDSKMVDLRQSDQRIAKAIEELDASVLGRKLYSVCEHDSFYVQHDWFNIVSEVNAAHIEQLRGQIEIAEAKAAEQKQKQAAIDKLPELENKMREMSKSVWKSLQGTNVQATIKEIVEAPQRRHELSVRRTQCIRQQAEYWKAYHKFLMQEKIIHDEKVSLLREKLRKSEEESAQTDAIINDAMKAAEDAGFIEVKMDTE